jgi:hypothetical protein
MRHHCNTLHREILNNAYKDSAEKSTGCRVNFLCGTYQYAALKRILNVYMKLCWTVSSGQILLIVYHLIKYLKVKPPSMKMSSGRMENCLKLTFKF